MITEKLLFVCNQGENRSRAGREIFERQGESDFNPEIRDIYNYGNPEPEMLVRQQVEHLLKEA